MLKIEKCGTSECAEQKLTTHRKEKAKNENLRKN